jgi:MFS family permease
MRTTSPASPGWRALLPRLSPDGRLLLLTTSIRNFAVSQVAIVLGLFLAGLGLEPATIGTVFTFGLAGGAVMTLWVSLVTDRLGRRRTAVVISTLMALGGLAFALTSQLWVLALAVLVGGINPVGKEFGSFLTVEQAMLPQTTSARERTSAFSLYSVVGTLASAFGALPAGLPVLLGIEAMTGYRTLLLAYALAGCLLVLLYTRLSTAIEPPRDERPAGQGAGPPDGQARRAGRAEPGPTPAGRRRPPGRFGLHRSRGLVFRYTAVSAIDSFGGGFMVSSVVAYWFSLSFGLNAAGLGVMFFISNLVGAASMLAAPWIARRIGLLNTMTLTQVPGNISLLLVPFMPSLEWAMAAWFGRHLWSQIDVPARQSYLTAIVAPDERSAATGLTVVARSITVSIAPFFAGATLAVPALGLPFLIGGGLKLLYDGLMFAMFRDVRPPEEQSARQRVPSAPGESAA